MTCIIGYIEGKTVHIGGDSCVTSGWMEERLRSPKVFQCGDYLIGGCGSAVDLQIMEHSFAPPIHSGGSMDKFMITEFWSACMEAFNERGRQFEKDGIKRLQSSFIIGVKGKLYAADGAGCMCRLRDKYMAIGCGQEYATGAMCVLDQYDLTPKQKIIAALKASAKHCAGVAAPFHVKSI